MQAPEPGSAGPFGPLLGLLGRGDLRDEDPLLRAAAEAGALIAFAIAPDGEILRVRGPVPDAITDARGDTEGQNVFELYADVPALLGAVVRALSGTRVRVLLVIDGTRLDCHYVPVRDASGAVAGVRGMALPQGGPSPEAMGLSARQAQCVRRLARGVSQAAIGRALHLAPGTVGNYLRKARETLTETHGLDLPSMGALHTYAVEQGWHLDADAMDPATEPDSDGPFSA